MRRHSTTPASPSAPEARLRQSTLEDFLSRSPTKQKAITPRRPNGAVSVRSPSATPTRTTTASPGTPLCKGICLSSGLSCRRPAASGNYCYQHRDQLNGVSLFGIPTVSNVSNALVDETPEVVDLSTGRPVVVQTQTTQITAARSSLPEEDSLAGTFHRLSLGPTGSVSPAPSPRRRSGLEHETSVQTRTDCTLASDPNCASPSKRVITIRLDDVEVRITRSQNAEQTQTAESFSSASAPGRPCTPPAALPPSADGQPTPATESTGAAKEQQEPPPSENNRRCTTPDEDNTDVPTETVKSPLASVTDEKTSKDDLPAASSASTSPSTTPPLESAGKQRAERDGSSSRKPGSSGDKSELQSTDADETESVATIVPSTSSSPTSTASVYHTPLASCPPSPTLRYSKLPQTTSSALQPRPVPNEIITIEDDDDDIVDLISTADVRVTPTRLQVSTDANTTPRNSTTTLNAICRNPTLSAFYPTRRRQSRTEKSGDSPTPSKHMSPAKSPQCVQCNGRNRNGKRCTRKVKVTDLTHYVGDSDDEAYYCHQHRVELSVLDVENAVFVPGQSKLVWLKFDAWINAELSVEIKRALRIEMEKPISDSDEPGFIYAYRLVEGPRSSHFDPTCTYYKIGRTTNLHRRLYQWSQHCGYTPRLIEFFPNVKSPTPLSLEESRGDDTNEETEDVSLLVDESRTDPTNNPFSGIARCKYVHRTERLIHIELSERYRADVKQCPGCGNVHREWFKVTASTARSSDATLVDRRHSTNTVNNGDMIGWTEMRQVIMHWITFVERTYGMG